MVLCVWAGSVVGLLSSHIESLLQFFSDDIFMGFIPQENRITNFSFSVSLHQTNAGSRQL